MAEFTSVDGLRIVYDVWGDADAGVGGRPPVVLHHGFVADTNLNWKLPGIVDAVVATGRRVVGMDARGHGRSAKPHDPAFYGEGKMARDVTTLADVLDVESYDLVGYSMGAIVSLVVATEDARVRRLVVGGVGAGVVELGGVDRRALAPATLVEALEADDPTTIVDPGAAQFRGFADSVGADRLALAAQARVVHASPIDLHRIAAPTLVLAGADDPLAARPQVLADAIPDATVRVVRGDHLSALVDPAFVASVVAFVG